MRRSRVRASARPAHRAYCWRHDGATVALRPSRRSRRPDTHASWHWHFQTTGIPLRSRASAGLPVPSYSLPYQPRCIDPSLARTGGNRDADSRPVALGFWPVAGQSIGELFWLDFPGQRAPAEKFLEKLRDRFRLDPPRSAAATVGVGLLRLKGWRSWMRYAWTGRG